MYCRVVIFRFFLSIFTNINRNKIHRKKHKNKFLNEIMQLTLECYVKWNFYFFSLFCSSARVTSREVPRGVCCAEFMISTDRWQNNFFTILTRLLWKTANHCQELFSFSCLFKLIFLSRFNSSSSYTHAITENYNLIRVFPLQKLSKSK